MRARTIKRLMRCSVLYYIPEALDAIARPMRGISDAEALRSNSASNKVWAHVIGLAQKRFLTGIGAPRPRYRKYVPREFW